MINTVTGPITNQDLGKTLMHEHIQFGYPGYQGDLTLGAWKKDDAMASIKTSMDIVNAHGVKTIVDATPNECGRDAAFLKEVSETFGVQIICSTGFYYEGEGGNAYFKFRSAFIDIVKEIEDMMHTEITKGIADTGVKAGVIKLASSKDQITDYERAFFTAGARVSIATGVPIITHTQEGTMGPAQAELLLGLGVPGDQIMIGHMDGNTNIEYHKKTLDHGVRIAFDRCGVQFIVGMPSDAERVRIFSELVKSGYTDRLHLSHDMILNMLGRPLAPSPEMAEQMAPIFERLYIGNIFDNIIPELMANGVTQEQIDKILHQNPKDIFSAA